ncbi:putative ribonuclease H-like domain-containing protein [Tanacetum coccineum]
MPDLEMPSDTLPNDGIFNGVVMLMMMMWVQRNKRGCEKNVKLIVKNKARLVAQGFRQEKGIDYDEVFAPVAKIKAIRLFLAFASYIGFTVYQMDVKSAFLYGTIKEEVYVHQPPGFVDPAHPNKVYKVIKALYGLHQAPRAWYETLSSFLMEMVLKKVPIDSKHCLSKKNQETTSTPIESNKPLVKDEDGVDVDVHVYRSMIGSLMYLTASRPDIMFADSPFGTRSLSHTVTMEEPVLGQEKKSQQVVSILVERLISWKCKAILCAKNSTTEFWTTAKSRTVNNISYIDATVTGKPVTISEASIRSDLIFDNADGIDSLNNQAIFDNIKLMGGSGGITWRQSSSSDSILIENDGGLTLPKL